jgi:hypothetical protein
VTFQGKANYAACLNLLIPGAGVILLGDIWSGLLGGLVFVLSANYALWATLLIPDEFPAWASTLGIGIAAGSYLAAQFRLAQTVRGREREQRAVFRRTALEAVRICLAHSDFAGALAALEPVCDLAGRDLLVAYRLAQSHTGLHDVEAARLAWRRVQALDRHHIYRAELRAAEEVLAQSHASVDRPSGSAPNA